MTGFDSSVHNGADLGPLQPEELKGPQRGIAQGKAVTRSRPNRVKRLREAQKQVVEANHCGLMKRPTKGFRRRLQSRGPVVPYFLLM